MLEEELEGGKIALAALPLFPVPGGLEIVHVTNPNKYF